MGMQQLKSLNKGQKEAVLHTEGPLLIVAGAGAGKTKTLTHRIVHLIATGVPPTSILAVTFTNKAAGEMRERVRNLLAQETPSEKQVLRSTDHAAGNLGQARSAPFVATFHALCVRILREFSAEAGISARFVIWDRDDSLRAIKAILKQFDVEWSPRGVLETMSHQKSGGVSQREFTERANTHREKMVARVWHAYENTLRKEGALDFDDLLVRALALLTSHKAVRSTLQDRWSHIHIDEYQDTNRTQYELVRILAERHNNVCAVGDVDQCIYTWRSATIENLLSFERAFPGTKVVLLEQNYRSTRTILTAANGVIAKNKNRIPKNLYTENETGEPIGLFAAENESDEAFFVATIAAQAIARGMQATNIAVLYRNNFQSRALEEALLALNVPYRVLGTRFFDRKEVKDLLSYVRVALNPNSRSDIARIIRTPPRGIGKQTLEKMFAGEPLVGAAKEKVVAFQTVLERMRVACETAPASEALRYAAETSGLIVLHQRMPHEEAEERLLNIYELINLAARYDFLMPPEGIERLLEEAALSSEQDELKEEINAVSLMTVHAAKGLEFDVVFVTGLEQGLFPHMIGFKNLTSSQEESERDPEEERRLFYVALTRAKKKVYISYAASRSHWGVREQTQPSEFLLDIDERLTEYVNYDKENIIT